MAEGLTNAGIAQRLVLSDRPSSPTSADFSSSSTSPSPPASTAVVLAVLRHLRGGEAS
jgi:hypothetical protein